MCWLRRSERSRDLTRPLVHSNYSESSEPGASCQPCPAPRAPHGNFGQGMPQTGPGIGSGRALGQKNLPEDGDRLGGLGGLCQELQNPPGSPQAGQGWDGESRGHLPPLRIRVGVGRDPPDHLDPPLPWAPHWGGMCCSNSSGMLPPPSDAPTPQGLRAVGFRAFPIWKFPSAAPQEPVHNPK